MLELNAVNLVLVLAGTVAWMVGLTLALIGLAVLVERFR